MNYKHIRAILVVILLLPCTYVYAADDKNVLEKLTSLQEDVSDNKKETKKAMDSIKSILGKHEKTPIISKELDQLEYLVFGEVRSGHKSNENRLDALGKGFYKPGSGELKAYNKHENITGKINALHEGLNQHNWKSDMYWLGASAMAVPSVNIVTTGLTLHVYPWYARAIQANLWEQDDFLRRSSLYLDISTVTGGGDFKGNTYSGPSYGAGIGFDVRKGFVLKAGVAYIKKSPTVGGANGSYIFQPTFGISITREFLGILTGGDS